MFGIIVIICFLLFLSVKKEKCVIWIAGLILPLTMLKGVNTITVFQILSFFVFIYFLISGRIKGVCKNYPLIMPVVAYALLYVIENIFNEPLYITSTAELSRDFLFPLCLWFAISSINDIKLYIKIVVVFFTILVIYGFFEAITNSNPFATWMVDNDLFTGWRGYSDQIRFGVKRIQSLLAYRDTLGATSSLAWIFLISVRKQSPDLFSGIFGKMSNFLILTLPIAVFLTGTRSCIAMLVICLLTLFSFNEKKRMLVFSILALLGFFIFNDYVMQIWSSFADTDSLGLGSSSADMRARQLEFCITVASDSPFIGHGIGFLGRIMADNHMEILGAESIWFKYIVDYGIGGIVAYIYMNYIFLRIGIKNKNKEFAIASIALLIGFTLSSLPGLDIAFLMIILVMMLKINIYTNQNYFQ